VPHSTQLDNERIATGTPESEAGMLVVRRHHLLVRCSHWLNVPILLGLILSGAIKLAAQILVIVLRYIVLRKSSEEAAKLQCLMRERFLFNGKCDAKCRVAAFVSERAEALAKTAQPDK